MPTRPPQDQSLEERCLEAGYPGSLMTCPDFVLSTLALAVMNHMDTALSSLGLRMRPYRMLRVLHEDGPQRQTALGAGLNLDRTTTVQLIDELEAAGFAKRERSPNDRRSYVVRITPKGTSTIREAIARVNEAERAMFNPLSEPERHTLQDLATRLLTEPGTIAEGHRREYDALIERKRT